MLPHRSNESRCHSHIIRQSWEIESKLFSSAGGHRVSCPFANKICVLDMAMLEIVPALRPEDFREDWVFALQL